MAAPGERWPPVYDADDLVREIKRLAEHPDLASFYEWRRDQSTRAPDDVCQGDVVRLASEVPLILEDGQPATMAHPDAAWLVIGNSCDFDRTLADVRWTQLVPLHSLGVHAELSTAELAAARSYTRARSFYVPAWTEASDAVFMADFLRPAAIDKRAFAGADAPAVVEARLTRAAWILLNACLVRFLARDDGRYA